MTEYYSTTEVIMFLSVNDLWSRNQILFSSIDINAK